ncbi:hypothetical protein [Trueperella pyogenes]|uniref:hypothetical protein n=1 Tax=Trueperella pyogenes TaxID=1661 RepID=UPI003DA9AAC5
MKSKTNKLNKKPKKLAKNIMTNKKPATTNNQPNHKSQASQKHNKKADTLLRYQTTHPHRKALNEHFPKGGT